jgi:hypothetical protein
MLTNNYLPNITERQIDQRSDFEQQEAKLYSYFSTLLLRSTGGSSSRQADNDHPVTAKIRGPNALLSGATTARDEQRLQSSVIPK